MIRLAVYSLELPHYACAQLRLLQPIAHSGGDIILQWGARSDGQNFAIDQDAIQGADLVLFQRYFPMQETWPIVERALQGAAPVLYDTDDNFLAVPQTHPRAQALQRVTPWVERLVREADRVSVSTGQLAAELAPLNQDVTVLPNCLDPGLWKLERPLRARGSGAAVTIAVSGTMTHGDDLELLRAPLRELCRSWSSGLRLLFYGAIPPWAGELGCASTVPFDEDYAAYARRLQRLDIDLALTPLQDNAFNRGKSDIKYLEYGACGIPGIYSALPPYEESVKHEQSGLLVENSPEAWLQAVTRLIRDPALRRRMARQAGEDAVRRSVAGPCGRASADFWRQAAQKA